MLELDMIRDAARARLATYVAERNSLRTSLSRLVDRNKLRGIDTRGRSKDECLDKIRGQLVNGVGGNGFNLAEDFDLAMDLGYGQFMWQTANYLKTDEADESA